MKECKWIKKLFAVLLLLSAAAGVFRGFVLFKYTDYANGLYTNETAGTVFIAVLLVILAVTAVLYFPLKKREIDVSGKNGALAKGISALCCVMLVIIAAMTAVSFVSDSFSVLMLIEAVLCVLSAVFFVINITATKEKLIKGIFEMFPALYIAIHTIIIFIDTTTQINASQRSFNLLFLVCLMMYFVTEAGLYIPAKEEKTDVEISKSAAQYKIWAVVSAGLALAVVLPGIVFSAATGKITAVLYGITHLFLAVYALIKI